MIPASHISPGAIQVLMQWLDDEIRRATSERRPLEERWAKWQRQYKAIPAEPVKRFPFYGASNLVLPLAATDVDTIFSRLMGILYGPENLWSCSPLREDMVDYAPRLQEFLKWAQHNELEAYQAVADWLLEICKLGTGVLKERYRREQKLVYEFRETPTGVLERLQRMNIKDSPVMEHVSLFDFLVPAGTVDHQKSAWCAERVMLSWDQYLSRVRAGVYRWEPRIQGYLEGTRGSWLQRHGQEMQNFVPGRPRQLEFWEVWTDFDISGAGELPALVCTLHLDSRSYLRVDYNPFFHQERPFDVGRYLRQEKQFYGIGICEMQEMFQEEGTAMHNQRIDSGTISNAPMMKYRRGTAIKDDEPVFIGRWIPVDDMDDLQTLNFGRELRSTISDEQLTMSYSRQRTGVNDYVMGNSSAAVGYATAQTNIMQHTEAAKRFDQSLREQRLALSSAGRRVSELYQQFNTNGKEFRVLGPREGEMVRQVLSFPLELIRDSVAIEVTATSASLNKEVQIRTNTILMQMVSQFYQQLFQLMSMAVNPQVPPPLQILAYQGVIGSSTMMKRVLDSYDMQDIGKIIPDMQEILSGQQQQLGGLGVPADPTWGIAQQNAGLIGAGGPAGSMGQPGMGTGF